MALVVESLEGSEGNKEETDAHRLTVREVEQNHANNEIKYDGDYFF